MKISHVYILQCADQSYYTGVTSNLVQRIEKHQNGFYKNSYTYKRRPVKLVYSCEFTNIELAFMFETKLKKWSRAKKEALIKGEFDLLPELSKKKFTK